MYYVRTILTLPCRKYFYTQYISYLMAWHIYSYHTYAIVDRDNNRRILILRNTNKRNVTEFVDYSEFVTCQQQG